MTTGICIPAFQQPYRVPMTNLEPHEWLKDRRIALGLTQPQVEERTAKAGARITQGHLSKVENGNRPLASLGTQRMEALREALEISPETWASRTGLTIVAPSESKTRPIPQGLQDAIDAFGKRFPDLLDAKWQQYLAGFQWRRGIPEDPTAWLDLYRDLDRAGVVPGEE